jgi:diadenylate cyclase
LYDLLYHRKRQIKKEAVMTFVQHTIDIFQHFNWIWAVEILILAVVFYLSWSFFKKRNAIWLVYICMAVCLVVLISAILNFKAAKIYAAIMILCFIIFPVALFPADIKRSLFRASWKNALSSKSITDELTHEDITKTREEIVRACQNMSKNDVGSLIVIADKPMESVVESGTSLNSILTSELIETIFYPKSPLHDGAILVTANRIIAAGCYLPLTSRNDLPKEFGTRHRAAIGISEATPSVTAIVVSEESGIISAVHDGKILRYLDGEKLTKVVEYALSADNRKALENVLWGE